MLSELRAPGQASLLGEAPLTTSTAQTKAIRGQMLADDAGSGSRIFANVNYAQQRFDGNQSSPRTASDNVNLTIGADMRSSDQLSAGVALGVARNSADVSGGGGYHLLDLSALAYATWHVGGGYVGGYGEWGHSNFTSIDRVIQLGPVRRTETADTHGTHGGLGLTGGWWFGQGTLKNGPFANLEWQSIHVDGFSEDGGDSTAMWFASQHRKALIGTLGWRVQGQWQAGGTALSPYAELAWNHDSKADPRDVTTGLTSMNGRFTLAGFIPDKTWGSVELGLAAQFSPNLSGSLSYDGRFSDSSQKYNSLNVGLKYSF